MKSRKVLALLCMAMLVANVLAGCNSGGNTGNKVESTDETTDTQVNASGEDTTASIEETATKNLESEHNDLEWTYEEAKITVLVDNDTSTVGFDAVCELAKEVLGITVTKEFRVGGNEGANIVKTRLASGDMADLCLYNSGANLKALNPDQYFIDISEYEWVERLDDTYRNTVTVEGKTFGVPYSSSSSGCVLYNKAVYEEYGLKVPTSWSEFMENCEVLKQAEKMALIGTFSDAWTSQVLFLGDFYNVNASDPDFANNFEAGITKWATSEAGLRSFEKLGETTEYYNADYLSTSYDDGCSMLVNGEGVHWVMLSQALTNIYSLYGEEMDNIGMFAIPNDDGEQTGLTVWMPGGLYANKKSKNEEAVLRFMEFYISDEALDAYTAAVLPDGPYCVKGYESEQVYKAVTQMQEYFDAGKTYTALEFNASVKGPNCASICQELVSGQTTPLEAAQSYDADCLKQATQLGLDWE